MSHLLRASAGFLLAAFLAGCASAPEQRTMPQTDPAAAQASRTLEHVVVVWLREPGNAAHRQRILAASEVLRTIPGVLSLKSGTLIPSTRSIVDSSFDVALIVSFADKTAMDAYLVHPAHVKLVKETLKPLVAKVRVFDFR